MMSINLIPAYRIHARRMRLRLRIWTGVVGACTLMLAVAHVWVIAAWHDDSDEIRTSIRETDSEIQELERATAASRAALAEAQATLRARRAVSDQPDWGLLLVALSARLDQQAVLSGCILEPAGQAGQGSAQRNDAQQKLIRPSKYTLSLTGLTRTQDAASSIAIALEQTGLFEYVTLLEARRAGFKGEEAVTFRLECALADPAAEVQ